MAWPSKHNEPQLACISLLRRRTSSSAYMPSTSSQYTAPLTAPLAPVPPDNPPPPPPHNPPPPGDVGVGGSVVRA